MLILYKPKSLFLVNFSMSKLVDDIFVALIPIVNRNSHFSQSLNQENTTFDQYDLCPHPGLVNLIFQMNIYRITNKFLGSTFVSSLKSIFGTRRKSFIY